MTDLPPCHVLCKCPSAKKLPVLELPFIRTQREKVGEKSSAMIVTVDQRESNKQVEAANKKQAVKEKRDEEKKKEKERKDKDDTVRVEPFFAEDPDNQLMMI